MTRPPGPRGVTDLRVDVPAPSRHPSRVAGTDTATVRSLIQEESVHVRSV
jgi:hypothetical protein